MIAALRAQLADALTGAVAGTDVTVYPAWPVRPGPPCLVVVPSSSTYLTPGPMFGEYTVGLDVVALVDRAAHGADLDALDALVETVLAACSEADWISSVVEAPSLVTVNAGDVLGIVVSLAKPGRLQP